MKVMKVKNTNRYHYILEWLNFKRISIPRVGKDMDNCYSHPTVGNAKWYNYFGNSLSVTYKAKPTFTIGHGHPLLDT